MTALLAASTQYAAQTTPPISRHSDRFLLSLLRHREIVICLPPMIAWDFVIFEGWLLIWRTSR
jgi:hypothetical protein